MFTPQEAARWTGGIWEHQPAVETFSAVTHDSRTVTPGCLYVAIRGETHDGHLFAAAARTAGAAAIDRICLLGCDRGQCRTCYGNICFLYLNGGLFFAKYCASFYFKSVFGTVRIV